MVFIIISAGAAIILIDNLADTLFSFFFAGIIPYTDISIPPLVMLGFNLLIAAFIIRIAIIKELYFGSPKVVQAHRHANKQAAKKLDQKAAVARRQAIRRKAKLTNTTVTHRNKAI